jgi:hypothetical protein
MTNLQRSSRRGAGFLAGLVVFLAACSDAPTAAAPAPAVNAAVAEPSARPASTSATLLACPSTTADSARAVIGPRGGSVSVGGSSLVVPPSAVATPTTFTLVAPASPVVQVEVHAAGVDHYEFAHPVTVSVSYARCDDAALPTARLGAWWVDGATLERLGVMAARDDRRQRRVTFITDHLSGYAVVY